MEKRTGVRIMVIHVKCKDELNARDVVKRKYTP